MFTYQEPLENEFAKDIRSKIHSSRAQADIWKIQSKALDVQTGCHDFLNSSEWIASVTTRLRPRTCLQRQGVQSTRMGCDTSGIDQANIFDADMKVSEARKHLEKSFCGRISSSGWIDRIPILMDSRFRLPPCFEK
jgi:hypothetical protein